MFYFLHFDDLFLSIDSPSGWKVDDQPLLVTYQANYHNLFTTDARRDARKAFLAFSANDVKSEIPSSEPFQEDDDIVSPQPAKGDISSSQSTPVRKIIWVYIF